MNYTAAVLAAATGLIVGCGPTTVAAEGTSTGKNTEPSAVTAKPISYPDWKGMWKREVGPAEILPDAAHIRMKNSGRVLRLIFLKPLNGSEAERASQNLNRLIKGKNVRCQGQFFLAGS